MMTEVADDCYLLPVATFVHYNVIGLANRVITIIKLYSVNKDNKTNNG